MQRKHTAIKLLFHLIFFICLYGCSINSSEHENNAGKKQFGFYIENGPRQGFQYFDSTGLEYNYRYYTITITNDTLIPMRLEIAFAKEYNDMRLNDNLVSKVFLLPRQLTPERQQLDHSMSKELKSFLDRGIDKPEYLNKTIQPKEKCVITFGIITHSKDNDPTTPFSSGLITSTGNSSLISLELKLNEFVIIPCGQISYLSK